MARFRCPVCGTRRTDWNLLVAHQRQHVPGYHHPHRPSSPFCESRPTSGVAAAIRAGWEPTDDELLDALIEVTLTTAGRPLRQWPYPEN